VLEEAGCQCPPDSTPLSYVAYKLAASQTISVDGKLDDSAWSEVSWTEEFKDIQGPSMLRPWFSTRAKIRWDDQRFYVGAYMEETQVWANMTVPNSIVYKDNDFEIFVDPDATAHNYKEVCSGFLLLD